MSDPKLWICKEQKSKPSGPKRNKPQGPELQMNEPLGPILQNNETLDSKRQTSKRQDEKLHISKTRVSKESLKSEEQKFLSSFSCKVSSEYKLCKGHANESWYQEETTSKSWIDKKCTSEDRLLQEDKFLSLKEKASKFQLSEARLEGDISKRHEDLVKCWFQSKNNNESNHLNKYEVKPKLSKKGKI